MEFLKLPLIKFGEVDKVLDEIEETAGFHSTRPVKEIVMRDKHRTI